MVTAMKEYLPEISWETDVWVAEDATQRYHPSTFYTFDEVDIFLDGSNVELLAKIIKQQAEQPSP